MRSDEVSIWKEAVMTYREELILQALETLAFLWRILGFFRVRLLFTLFNDAPINWRSYIPKKMTINRE
jgi:hypothetical protein